jgi:hypothetical protein
MGRAIVRDYIDESGIRCIEDDRGTYHFFIPNTGGTSGDINVYVPEIKIPEIPPAQVHIDTSSSENSSEEKRLRRIMEALRSENNWLWEQVSKTIRDKKTPQKSIERLEKAIKERQR